MVDVFKEKALLAIFSLFSPPTCTNRFQEKDTSQFIKPLNEQREGHGEQPERAARKTAVMGCSWTQLQGKRLITWLIYEVTCARKDLVDH